MAKFLDIPQYVLSAWETGKDYIPEDMENPIQQFFLDFDIKYKNGEFH